MIASLEVYSRILLTKCWVQVLKDGAYLELISFTHPASHYPPGSPERQERDANPWAWKEPGWIDYAFLGSSSTSLSELINARAKKDKSRIRYDPEVDGGRERSDGKVLKWRNSAPSQDDGRGIAPFFCGDVTPREWRVCALFDTYPWLSQIGVFQGPTRSPFECRTSVGSTWGRIRPNFGGGSRSIGHESEYNFGRR